MTDDGLVIAQGAAGAVLWRPRVDEQVDLGSHVARPGPAAGTPAGLVVTDTAGGSSYLAEISDAGVLRRIRELPSEDAVVSPGQAWFAWTQPGTLGGEVTRIRTLRAQKLDGSSNLTWTAPTGWAFRVGEWQWEDDRLLVAPVAQGDGPMGERLARCSVRAARCMLSTHRPDARDRRTNQSPTAQAQDHGCDAGHARDLREENMHTRGAVIKEAPGTYEVTDLELDDPRQGELQVKMAASGLCHSDDHIATGDIPVGHYPMCGGHEGAGVVTAVGPNTTGFEEGDHVVFSFLPGCGRCRWCASGHAEPLRPRRQPARRRRAATTRRASGHARSTAAPVGQMCGISHVRRA